MKEIHIPENATNGEALSILNDEVITHIKSLGVTNKNSTMYKALDVAIKVLEQQPCEDCISRQAVNVLVDELARAISDERCCMSRGRSTATIMQDILDLPSVTPII